jgi:uncharacterized protein YllA (UPF0747 family)
MSTPPVNQTVEPLALWEPVHAAAMAFASGDLVAAPSRQPRPTRSAALASALAAANLRWGNPVDAEIARWLAGAEVVVTGQQPGLLGGPLLTLVKAAAVIAEVGARRRAGRPAVGFLWLATADDDLPEMGWGRVVNGPELVEVQERGWQRGGGMAGSVVLTDACAAVLSGLSQASGSSHAREALDLAARCYRPGATLGEATATFLGGLLAGTGIVLVDALTSELAVAGTAALTGVLERLPHAWEALENGSEAIKQRGWSPPVRLEKSRLPVFRRVAGRRERLATVRGGSPTSVVQEFAAHPERFVPNVWTRPLLQDAALDTSLAILGGAELAYHLQAAAVWDVAGVRRPEWRLRPHATIVTSADRRLARQLSLSPADLLRPRPPLVRLGGRRSRAGIEGLRRRVDDGVGKLRQAAAAELPASSADVEATAQRLEGALAWLADRLANAATRQADVEVGRFRRLQAFLRPAGRPQERHLSVLAPVMRLGLTWPTQLAAAIDPAHPGMHLLFWEEGQSW